MKTHQLYSRFVTGSPFLNSSVIENLAGASMLAYVVKNLTVAGGEFNDEARNLNSTMETSVGASTRSVFARGFSFYFC